MTMPEEVKQAINEAHNKRQRCLPGIKNRAVFQSTRSNLVVNIPYGAVYPNEFEVEEEVESARA